MLSAQSLLSGPAVLDSRLNPRIPKGLGESWHSGKPQTPGHLAEQQEAMSDYEANSLDSWLFLG